jgi:multicomponent K+:H+ antiporter subunit D
MADIARKLPMVPTGDLGLLHAAAALLGVAFLVKAALWPLNFWLPPAYAAASAPASAMFAILTKVGIYAVLRLWTLCFPDTAGASALFGHQVLLWGGLATMAFGAIGMLGSQHLGRLASYAVITSSGTVLAAVSLDVPALTAGALFYMASSTLAAAALFLLVELVERSRQVEVDPPSPDEREDRLPMFGDRVSPLDANLDDQQVALVGRAFPAALAYLGLTFLVCTVVLSGLPPLSGFIGKVAMLSALLEVRGSLSERWPAAAWSFFGLVFVSGLFAAVALTRAFIAHFWALQERAAPRLRVAEGVPVALLLGGCLSMAIAAESTLQYMRATAVQLHSPHHYIDAMLRAQPRVRPAMDQSTTPGSGS